MWILIFIVILIFVVSALVLVPSFIKEEKEQDIIEQKKRTEKDMTIQEVLDISQEMLNHPRIVQLIGSVVNQANKYQFELDHIWLSNDWHNQRIIIKLRDEQVDRFSPVQSGREVVVGFKEFDLELHTPKEKAALFYLILSNCPYLEYSYYIKADNNTHTNGYYKPIHKRSRDLREAMLNTVDYEGDRIFIQYHTSLYNHTSSIDS